MNIMSIAAASIVDANTGNGINQKFVDQLSSNYVSHEKHGREIRANTFITLLAKIKGSVKAYIERSIVVAQEWENIRVISSMSDHLQKDIGLIQIDIDDLRSGLISLNSLNARREQNLNQELITLPRSGYSNVQEIENINEEGFTLKKCA